MASPLHCDETANVSKITAVQNPLCMDGHDDQSDPTDFPDGGLTAWGTALGA